MKGGSVVIQPGSSRIAEKSPVPVNGLSEEISQSNEAMLQGMTPGQLEKERRDILEHFGPGIEDFVKRVREAKEKRAASSKSSTGE